MPERSLWVTQVVFAVIAPRQVVPNLVAGAIAEAGANQAGDMMQVRFPAHVESCRRHAHEASKLQGFSTCQGLELTWGSSGHLLASGCFCMRLLLIPWSEGL